MILNFILVWYIIAFIAAILLYFIGWRNIYGKLKRYDLNSSLFLFFGILFLPVLIIIFSIIIYRDKTSDDK